MKKLVFKDSIQKFVGLVIGFIKLSPKKSFFQESVNFFSEFKKFIWWEFG